MKKCIRKISFLPNRFKTFDLTQKEIITNIWNFHQIFILIITTHDTIFNIFTFFRAINKHFKILNYISFVLVNV